MAAGTMHLALGLVAPLRLGIPVILETIVITGLAVDPEQVVSGRTLEFYQAKLGPVPVVAIAGGGVAPWPTALVERPRHIPHLEDLLFVVVKHRLSYDFHAFILAAILALLPWIICYHDGVVGILGRAVLVTRDAAGFIHQQIVDEELLAVADVDNSRRWGGRALENGSCFHVPNPRLVFKWRRRTAWPAPCGNARLPFCPASGKGRSCRSTSPPGPIRRR